MQAIIMVVRHGHAFGNDSLQGIAPSSYVMLKSDKYVDMNLTKGLPLGF